MCVYVCLRFLQEHLAALVAIIREIKGIVHPKISTYQYADWGVGEVFEPQNTATLEFQW